MIQIKKVQNSDDLKAFIDFPHDLYASDPNYVPELFIAQRDLMSSKHPFFEHSSADSFLAIKDGKVAGRIAAIRNNNHIKATGKQEGFFGFFDTINDYEVAKKLFDTATTWIKNQGLSAIIGPTNFSTNETCGMLCEGFDSPPAVMLTYNKAYYNDFATKYGFQKKVDLLAYNLPTDKMPDKVLTISNQIEERLKKRGIVIRKINLKKFKQEVEGVKKIYNEAWDKNLGFVPMSDSEFNYLAKDMKMIMDPDFCLIAEHDGKIIGFSLCLPDVNQALIKVKRGRLLPFGLFKLLYYKGKINKVRVIALGVIEAYRKAGIEACFYARTIQTAREKKMIAGDASWILENNLMMNRALINLNGEVYKKFRLYELNLQ